MQRVLQGLDLKALQALVDRFPAHPLHQKDLVMNSLNDPLPDTRLAVAGSQPLLQRC
jgi:hypothetical protein